MLSPYPVLIPDSHHRFLLIYQDFRLILRLSDHLPDTEALRDLSMAVLPQLCPAVMLVPVPRIHRDSADSSLSNSDTLVVFRHI